MGGGGVGLNFNLGGGTGGFLSGIFGHPKETQYQTDAQKYESEQQTQRIKLVAIVIGAIGFFIGLIFLVKS